MKGKGNSINYKYRIHDPRIGRFFACDPLEPKYPWYTPYQFSGNKVIHAIELEGLEENRVFDDIPYIESKPVVDAPTNLEAVDNFCHNVLTVFPNAWYALCNGFSGVVNYSYDAVSSGKNGSDIMNEIVIGVDESRQDLEDDFDEFCEDPGGFVYETFAEPMNYSNAIVEMIPLPKIVEVVPVVKKNRVSGGASPDVDVPSPSTSTTTPSPQLRNMAGGDLLYQRADVLANEIKAINSKYSTGNERPGMEGGMSNAINSASYYDTKSQQGAAIFRSIVTGHIFNDGVKRTASEFLTKYAKANGLKLRSGVDLEDLTKVMADGVDYPVEQLSGFLFEY